ncbi:hypothetical protein Avbf_04723, partial [Armadillidium vulgare]
MVWPFHRLPVLRPVDEGALVSASGHSPTLAPETTSLRNLSFSAALSAGALHECRRGAPNSELSTGASARRRTAETQLGSPYTASPRPLLLASPSEILSREVSRLSFCHSPTPRSGSNLSSLRNLLLGSLSAGGCCTDVQRGPRTSELSTKLYKAGGQRDTTWLSLYCVSTSSSYSRVPRGFSAESSLCRDVYKRQRLWTEGCSSSQLLPLVYARSGSNLSYETSLLTACLLADACTDVQRGGPELPNSRPSFCEPGGQRDATLALLVLRLNVLSYSRVLRGFSAESSFVSSVKAFCGQKGALVPASAPRLRSLRKATSLRNLLCWQLCLLAECCTDVQRGPELPNSRPLRPSPLRDRADSGTQLCSSSTASPSSQ